ncbi:MAG: helix-turn-helix domain-containing protein [Gemmatimonadetes bacterium]|nr:helix-turn-helix domain-containing protein [Gemmatimonadota bacterium]
MNVSSKEKQAAILRALVEGNSIRATSRMVGCSKNTVSRLLRIIGDP